MSKLVGFVTLGCKVNTYESDALKEELTKRGFKCVEACDDCDVYIINTCSVTNMADRKSRQMIRKCIKMNPSAVICAMGCYTQTSKEASNIEGVDILIGNGNKTLAVDKIIEALNGQLKEKYINILDILNTQEYEKLGVTTYDHTRAFVKIEDGCNQFCSYCIIPYARGPVRCKAKDDVLNELKTIAKNGYKEVVLTGIHTGRYKDDGTNLSGLLKLILEQVPELKRIRLSSIEINEIDDDFIELMSKSDVMANHLHLPLQSGSNKILKLMGRPYDRQYFIDKVNKIKKIRNDIQISTDIIVGFPEETEEDFMDTYNLCKELGMAKLHVFPFSKRSGTKAASMKDIHPDIKKERVDRLIDLSKELELEYAKKFIGKTLDAIVEQKVSDGFSLCHTSNFLTIHVPYDKNIIKKLVDVKILNIENDIIYGEVIKKYEN
ncbi:MAG: tRNA (N(6)-L-threonylcarbamoyladenosine(37)-C(2))-methylthiotransferase MtaB [Acholeplasmatales bacterium]|nr:tRNA (N(6)-L-threonylcarbamoyladenosine(37)-C(2))-methylthiotransferase MtaB [Acholeplasmatales bacterium]